MHTLTSEPQDEDTCRIYVINNGHRKPLNTILTNAHLHAPTIAPPTSRCPTARPHPRPKQRAGPPTSPPTPTPPDQRLCNRLYTAPLEANAPSSVPASRISATPSPDTPCTRDTAPTRSGTAQGARGRRTAQVGGATTARGARGAARSALRATGPPRRSVRACWARAVARGRRRCLGSPCRRMQRAAVAPGPGRVQGRKWR